MNANEATLLAPRPGYGTVGRDIRLYSNSFPIIFHNSGVYLHEVEILHNVIRKLNRKQCKEILYAVKQRSPVGASLPFDGADVAYDGGRNVLTTTCPKQLLIKGTFEVSENCQTLHLKLTRKPGTITIKWKCLGLKQLELSRAVDLDLHRRDMFAVQAIDWMLRESKTNPLNPQDFVQCGRKFCQRNQVITRLVPGLELWAGYIAQCCIYSTPKQELNFYLNVDIANQVFYRQQPLKDYVAQFLRMRNVQQLQQLNDRQYDALSAALKGLEVYAEVGKTRTYKIDGLSDIPVKMKFPLREDDAISDDGSVSVRETNVLEYYAETYKYRLRYPNLPCIRSGPVHVPIEACSISGDQQCNEKSTDEQRQDMIKATCVDAPRRMQKINSMREGADFNNDVTLREFGLEIRPEMIKVLGRVLPAQKQQYLKVQVPVRDGAWTVGEYEENRQKKVDHFYDPAVCGQWAILLLTELHEPDVSKVQDFLKQVAFHGRFCGMKIPDTSAVIRHAKKQDKIQEMLEECLEITFQKTKQKCDLVFMILPDRGTVYGAAKRIADTVVGVTTQGIRWNTITRYFQKPANKSTIRNLIVQINTKLWGWSSNVVQDPLVQNVLSKKKTLIVAIDAIHPKAFDRHTPSVAGIVGTSGAEPCFHIWTDVVIQNKGNREQVYMMNAMLNMLRKYVEDYKEFPERVLVLRDGVSDGQFAMVIENEVAEMKAACAEFMDFIPKFTVTVVKKRHHHRQFCGEEKDQNGRGLNCPPGTVIDKGVTSPNGFDFFLFSHQGIQGTSRPAHYFVILDENGFSADEMQMSMYALCHVDGRSLRTRSIPCPVAWADIVCAKSQSYLVVSGRIQELERDGLLQYDNRGNAIFSPEQIVDLQAEFNVHPYLNGGGWFM